MKFSKFLVEMFNDTDEYKSEMISTSNSFHFIIYTGERKNYKLEFKKYKEHFYVAELVYKSGKFKLHEELYDAKKLINTLQNIFIGLYLSNKSVDAIYYKFLDMNKSYKLLINHVFKKELSNYYSILNTGIHRDFGSTDGLMIYSNKLDSNIALDYYNGITKLSHK